MKKPKNLFLIFLIFTIILGCASKKHVEVPATPVNSYATQEVHEASYRPLKATSPQKTSVTVAAVNDTPSWGEMFWRAYSFSILLLLVASLFALVVGGLIRWRKTINA